MGESQPGLTWAGFFPMKRTRKVTELIIEKRRQADLALLKG